MKKISIEEADKILAAHPPKIPECTCGLQEKVKSRIKELEDWIDKNYDKKNHFYPTIRIEELKELLSTKPTKEGDNSE